MVWWEGKKSHHELLFLHDKSKRNELQKQAPYPIYDVPSATRPILHDPDHPLLELDSNMEYSSDSEHSDMTVVAGNDAYWPEEDDQPLLLTQAELNDLIRDLKLSKESAQLQASRLKEKHLLAP